MSEKLSFKLTSSDLEANSLPPILNKPTIAKAKLASVLVDDIKGRNDEVYNVIDFNFKILDGEHTGHEFRHRVFGYKPYAESTDQAKDQENWGKRLAYVLTYFIGEKNALAIMNADDNDWDQIRENVDRAFKAEKLKGWKDKIVRIKVGGYKTRAGKAVLGFPLYLGFISDSESKVQVTFSKRELQQNAEYQAAYDREISATSSATLNGEATGEGATATPETGMDF